MRVNLWETRRRATSNTYFSVAGGGILAVTEVENVVFDTPGERRSFNGFGVVFVCRFAFLFVFV